jgi:hypothetical protein
MISAEKELCSTIGDEDAIFRLKSIIIQTSTTNLMSASQICDIAIDFHRF